MRLTLSSPGLDAISSGGADSVSYHRAPCTDLTAVGVAPSWTPSRLGVLRTDRQVIPILRAATRPTATRSLVRPSVARLSLAPGLSRTTDPGPARATECHWPASDDDRALAVVSRVIPYVFARTLFRRRSRGAPGDVRRISRPQSSRLRPDHRIDATTANVFAHPPPTGDAFPSVVGARVPSDSRRDREMATRVSP